MDKDLGLSLAVIHDTTMSPGKLELLTAWLPGLSAPWRLADGTQARGILATADHTPVPGP